MSDLAIVIPAYKEAFFDETLNSLARQTNSDFTVYVGDDCSPNDLLSIVKKYKNRLTINYTRFSENIGAKNLVLQWERCIALTNMEKWLCLFSDDDLMDDKCVESFYQTIKQKGNTFDVYRFNTVTIDMDGAVLRPSIDGPEIESSAQMAYYLLKGQRGNSMPDHIFSRKIYNDYGGFVYTEYAQGADWAMSILYSRKKGICIIPNSKVSWRYSGLNISSLAAANRNSMINGYLQFVEWSLKHFEYLKTDTVNITYEMMIEALRENLNIVIKYHYKGFNFYQAVHLFIFFHKKLKLSYYSALNELIVISLGHIPIIRGLNRLIIRIENKIKRR